MLNLLKRRSYMDNLTKSIKYNGFKKVWVSDLNNGTFKNPIIYADYSDPDAIRVGDDFFMTASSFNCSPGLPLLHSKDLVNWKIVNHIIERLPFSIYDSPQYGKGVWAPAIRYHEEKFWVFFPTPDEGIFMTNTEDPFGKWSEPILIKEGKGWIDPCPFWDDDGNAYLVNAFAGSRAGFNSILNVCRMKWDGTGLLDEGVYVFDGNKNGHHTIEGPKVYKRNGYYYIFAPAGGVVGGWQTILRSKNIYGPYEDKIVLHQGNTSINGPHQGGLVELENGESWFIHFQDREEYGRIVHLQPVKWIDDWPIVGEDTNGDGIGEPVLHIKKPKVGESYPIIVPETSDDFQSQTLGLQWQWNANYRESWYSLKERGDYIRLYAVNDGLKWGNTLWHCPNLLLQKYPAPAFSAVTKLELNPSMENIMAGLVVSGDECFSLAVHRIGNYLRLSYFKTHKSNNNNMIQEEMEWVNVNNEPILLKVDIDDDAICSFSYSYDGFNFKQIGDKFKSKKTLWTGSKVGIFCTSYNQSLTNDYADFDWFLIEEKADFVL
jgi:beta-xylosidase